MTSTDSKIESTDNEWGWELSHASTEDGGNDDDTAGDSGKERQQVTTETSPKQQAMSPGKIMSPGKYSDPRLQAVTGGITSSPSFLELEKAIGATLALSISSDSIDQSSDARTFSPGGASPRTGSMSSTQQKWQQQQKRQQLQKQQQLQAPHYKPHPLIITPALTARDELNAFVNERESRAIILFHPPTVTVVEVRDACQKYGVLYYIRPEFHSKGVTLLSYFDLRAAIHAYSSLVADIAALAGAPGDSSIASVHYSVMLHAASNNSEEFRLSVKNVPETESESSVHNVFVQFGEVRSIQQVVRGGEEEGEGEGQPVSTAASTSKGLSFVVEFFNIQDARLAVSELSTTTASQIWSGDTEVIFAPLDARRQKLCRLLLQLLSKWRIELANSSPYGSLPPAYQMTMMTMSPHHNYNPIRYASEMGLPSPMPMMMSQMGPGQLNPHMIYSSLLQHPYPPNPYGPGAAAAAAASAASVAAPAASEGQEQTDTSSDTPSPLTLEPDSSEQEGQSALPDSAYSKPVYGYGNSMVANPYQSHMPMYQQASMYDGRGAGAGAGAGTGRDKGGRGASAYNQQLQMQEQMYQQQYQQQLAMQHMQQQQYQYQLQQQQQQMQHQNMRYGQQQQQMGRGGMRYQNPAGSYIDQRPHHHNGGHGYATNVRRPPAMANAMHSQGGGGGGGGDSEFALDLESLLNGTEVRTTIMIRNIPNKYNQHMLLEEVNVNHEGTYDFFYLPIDFKNKCNVGYGFINFLDPQHILPFMQEFNGQRWQSFNSEKVCAVSFARIQGKAAMVSRFQNSSLLEKDDTYRPLLFYSSGPDRGKPEPFPTAGVRYRGQGGTA